MIFLPICLKGIKGTYSVYLNCVIHDTSAQLTNIFSVGAE